MSESARELLNGVAGQAGAAFAFVLGIVVTHLFTRLVGRMAAVRWNEALRPQASNIDVRQFGRVEVLFNGEPTQDLYWCFVELENESSRDFQDVTLFFEYKDGSTFMGTGTVAGTDQFLPFSARFRDNLLAWQNPDTDQSVKASLFHWLNSVREFTLPVFNRGHKVGFTFLVQSSAGEPRIHFSIAHPGLRLRKHVEKPSLLGVPQQTASLVGFALGFSICGLLAQRTPGFDWPLWFVFYLGTASMLIGALLVRLQRVIAKWFA